MKRPATTWGPRDVRPSKAAPKPDQRIVVAFSTVTSPEVSDASLLAFGLAMVARAEKRAAAAREVAS